ncbi:hypothetical protein [Nonomuraea lactucae]|uniref:hypothetical protein n=1 Tax=Nonomuraea lactucae TaxID=2249762 RepID=UPI000DE2CCEC|nr:hypothetical protein [Nonomuraea lactucae]
MTTFPRLAASALLLVGLVAACSSGGGGGGTGGAPIAGGADEPIPDPTELRVFTVEQLAAKVGCKPRIQVDAKDIRTGYCKTKVGQFFVNTFLSEKDKDVWMDRAPEYNPHLVGHRWTVLSSLNVLKALQKPLNGDLHLNDHRTKSPQPAQPAGGY